MTDTPSPKDIVAQLEESSSVVITFPNAMTPEQREEVDLCLSALEQEAEKWAVEIDLPKMAKMLAHTSRLAPHAPADVRENFIARQEGQIAAMIEQAFIEGAYRGCSGAYDSVRAGYDPHTRSLRAQPAIEVLSPALENATEWLTKHDAMDAEGCNGSTGEYVCASVLRPLLAVLRTSAAGGTRDEVIEECAAVAERQYGRNDSANVRVGNQIAADIRKLKSTHGGKEE